MEIEQLNFDFGKIEDKTFEDIKQKQICARMYTLRIPQL